LKRHIVPEISPNPSFPKRGITPFCKACPPVDRGGKEGFSLRCPYNYGLIINYQVERTENDDAPLAHSWLLTWAVNSVEKVLEA
jgi:hypothetical protein